MPCYQSSSLSKQNITCALVLPLPLHYTICSGLVDQVYLFLLTTGLFYLTSFDGRFEERCLALGARQADQGGLARRVAPHYLHPIRGV